MIPGRSCLTLFTSIETCLIQSIIFPEDISKKNYIAVLSHYLKDQFFETVKPSSFKVSKDISIMRSLPT